MYCTYPEIFMLVIRLLDGALILRYTPFFIRISNSNIINSYFQFLLSRNFESSPTWYFVFVFCSCLENLKTQMKKRCATFACPAVCASLAHLIYLRHLIYNKGWSQQMSHIMSVDNCVKLYLVRVLRTHLHNGGRL